MGKNNNCGCNSPRNAAAPGSPSQRNGGSLPASMRPGRSRSVEPDELTLRMAASMFPADSENPLKPTATGHTLPFAANGIFCLPKQMVDETPSNEPMLKPAPGLGAGLNAILAESARLQALQRGTSDAGYRRTGQPLPAEMQTKIMRRLHELGAM